MESIQILGQGVIRRTLLRHMAIVDSATQAQMAGQNRARLTARRRSRPSQVERNLGRIYEQMVQHLRLSGVHLVTVPLI